MPRVLIQGMGKSGTTALYYKIKAAMPEDATALFEHKVCTPEDMTENVVAKSLFGATVQWETFGEFDKNIVIIRDPRDRLVSALLYSAHVLADAREENSFADPRVLFRKIEILREKERNPSSHSLIDVFEIDPLTLRERWESSEKLLLSRLHHPDVFVFHYEDLVEGRFEELEDYLGFGIERDSEVGERHDRVVRSKKTGQWRHYLTESDVEYWRPLFANFVERFGYATDWTLASPQVIDPSECSEYVMRIVAKRVCGEAAQYHELLGNRNKLRDLSGQLMAQVDNLRNELNELREANAQLQADHEQLIGRHAHRASEYDSRAVKLFARAYAFVRSPLTRFLPSNTKRAA